MALYRAGQLLARFERWRQGPLGYSALLEFVSFGSFSKAFKPNRTPFDWLSRDRWKSTSTSMTRCAAFAAAIGCGSTCSAACSKSAPAARPRARSTAACRCFGNRRRDVTTLATYRQQDLE